MAQKNLSVIITCHNEGESLAQCLQSVLGQSYAPDEIIIVNDSSTDTTKEIAERFQESHGIKYLEVEHNSPTESRFSGIKIALGEIVCCIDADHRIDPTYFEYGLECFNNDSRVAIVYSDTSYYNSDHSTTNHPPSTNFGDLSQGNYIHIGSLIRKDVLVDSGILEDRSLSHNQHDWNISRKIISLGFLGVKQKSLYYYNSHEGNIFGEYSTEKESFSYYKRAALAEETVTLVVTLSGDSDLWNDFSSYLEKQSWDHNKIVLVFVDTSNDDQYSAKVRKWLFNSDYAQVFYSRNPNNIAIGDHYSEDTGNIEISELIATELQQELANRYNLYRQFAHTNYIWTLTDDLIPPLDTCEELLRCFCDRTVSVTAAIEDRFSSNYAIWKKGFAVSKKGNGVEIVEGNSFSCALIRTSLFKKMVFHSRGALEKPEMGFYQAIAGKRLAKVNWSLNPRQLSRKITVAQEKPEIEIQIEVDLPITEETFDNEFYLAVNPDVRIEVEKGEFQTGYQHFIEQGSIEGRSYRISEGDSQASSYAVISTDNFNEDFYLEVNPDVKQGVDSGELSSGYDHFVGIGVKEGRAFQLSQSSSGELTPPMNIYSNNFDEEFYLEVNPDVREALLDDDFNSGYQHFIEIGVQEGRAFRVTETPSDSLHSNTNGASQSPCQELGPLVIDIASS